VNRGLLTTLGIIFVYLCIAVAVIILILMRLNRRIQLERDKRLKMQEKAVQNLKYQLSVIEAVSKDYTDVMLVDVNEKKTNMLKIDQKMENYANRNWRPYEETWQSYIEKYVVAEDREKLRERINLDRVMEVLSKEEEEVCNYRIYYQGKIYNYQIKYVKSDDEDEHMIVGAFRNIDDSLKEERKRIQLERQSNTDELTRLPNRRAYETAIKEHHNIPKENFVYIAMDVNGLKLVNDTLGHECGDELLRGAAACMKQSFGLYGQVYRIGGDEFAAMISVTAQKLEEIKKNFEYVVSSWSGEKLKELSVSCGYAAKKEFPNMMVNELAKVADARMYKAKQTYYSKKGIDRRGQQSAFKIICQSYIKVLRVNLTDDSYQEIYMNSEETNFGGSFSNSLFEFAKSDRMHREDVEEYLAHTNLDDIRRYFRKGNQVFRIFYRRANGSEYQQVMMEMIAAPEYSHENQIVFLYIKEIMPERCL
jgi:diguanylate cyclase (GGDEF)-like protein